MSFLFKHSFVVSMLASCTALGFALIGQFAFNLQPCVLCVYQRWPYVAVILFAFAGLMLAKKIGSELFHILVALSFAVTSGIGGFHVGVEQGWWEGTAECVADTSVSLSMEQLKAQILSAPLAKCDEIAWELFGISMAGYNMLFAGGLAFFMIVSLYQKKRLPENGK